MRHLLAVQAQDAASVPYALRARGGELRDGLLVTWLMRSTLHLVDADDLTWLHPLFAPRMVTANERRLRQLGVTEDHTDALVAALPATRAELAAQFDLPGQALPHALHRAAIAGRLAMTPGGAAPASPRAPGDAASPASAPRVFVPLNLPPAPDRDASLDELARRYYACHAGADQRDLAYWSGLPLRDCRPPASTASRRRACPRRAHPGVRRAPARLARPHPHRPARARQARPSGRRHPAGGRARGRGRRRHVVARRRPGQRRTFLNGFFFLRRGSFGFGGSGIRRFFFCCCCW